MKQDWFIVAKMFNEQGCKCYKCKTAEEFMSLPGYLELICNEGMQIVVLNNTEIYSEYAPYTFIEDRDAFIEYIKAKYDQTAS